MTTKPRIAAVNSAARLTRTAGASSTAAQAVRDALHGQKVGSIEAGIIVVSNRGGLTASFSWKDGVITDVEVKKPIGGVTTALNRAARTPTILDLTSDIVGVSHGMENVGDEWKSVRDTKPCILISPAGWVTTLGHQEDPRGAVDEKLRLLCEENGHVEVRLTHEQHELFYNLLCNSFFWPAFHLRTDLTKFCEQAWDSYREVNRQKAETAASLYGPGKIFFVHDYQEMLVPGLLRESCPKAPIGYFHHIPWPKPDQFHRMLLAGVRHGEPSLTPAQVEARASELAREILSGLLGADLIAFHTKSYARNFVGTVERYFGAVSAEDGQAVLHGGRKIGIKAIPIGIDTHDFEEKIARSPEAQKAAVEYSKFKLDAPESERSERKIVASYGRADYTKGFDRLAQSARLLFDEHPELKGKVQFILSIAPSRGEIPAYKETLESIQGEVDRTNREHGTPDWTPIKLDIVGASLEQMAGLLQAADVTVFGSERDGYGLVVNEAFAAGKPGHVAVVSSRMGAADTLGEHSVMIDDPTDAWDFAEALYKAVAMPQHERKRKKAAGHRKVNEETVDKWNARLNLELLALRLPETATKAA